jgi:hypothetical protein
MEETKDIDFRAMARTAVRVITSPAAFFREMPRTGGFGGPIVFMMVMGLAAGIVNAVLSIIGLHIGMGIGMALVSIIIYPLVGAVLGFIGAAIVFVIWKLMGSREPYETAYRCVAYLAALWPITTALNVVPYIGVLIVIAIWVYFYVIASIETHKISSRRAWLVFGIIGAILIAMSFGFIIAQRAMMEESSKYRKQLEQSTEEMQKNSEEAQKALEEMQKQLEKK